MLQSALKRIVSPCGVEPTPGTVPGQDTRRRGSGEEDAAVRRSSPGALQELLHFLSYTPGESRHRQAPVVGNDPPPETCERVEAKWDWRGDLTSGEGSV